MGWDAMRGRTSRCVARLVAVMCLFVLAAATTRAQTTGTVSITNGTLRAEVGYDASAQLNSVNIAGRFGIYEVGTAASALMTLPRAAATPGSYVTIRIDGGAPTDTTVTSGWDLIFGDPDDGTWQTIPNVTDGKIVASWVTSPGDGDVAVPSIKVDLVVSVVHDMVLYRFTVTNLDVKSHRIGLRFAQDFDVPGGSDAPVITPSFSDFSGEREFVSGEMPSRWIAYDSTGDHSVGGLLAISGHACVPSAPDRVVFGTAADVTYPRWTVVPSTLKSFATDGACALYFTPTVYGATEQKVFSAIVGRAQTSTVYEGPVIGPSVNTPTLVAGVESPRSLEYDATAVNSSDKGATDPDARLSPNPLTISGFLYNGNVISIQNIRAVLSTLPTGLSLATGETTTKTLGTLSPNTEAGFSWKVNANGQGSGRLTYSVSYSADPGSQGVSLTRYIDIPALPDMTWPAELDMVSFPYQFSVTTPTTALGLRALDFDLLQWNTTYTDYQVVSALKPGDGYWLRLGSQQTISLQGATEVKAPTGYFERKLSKGWNQIGNPFLMRIRWADVKVINTDASDPEVLVPLTIDVASNAYHEWVLPTLYGYDKEAGAYEWVDDFSSELLPYSGYWVKSLKDGISLLLPVPTGRSAKVGASSRSWIGSGGWRQRIAVSDGKTVDDRNYIGVCSSSADGYDLRDVEKPPAVSSGTRAGLVRADWGTRSGLYAQDLQSSGRSKKEWEFRVSGEANANVTLSWPDISSLPRTVTLYVVDSSTGVRQSMSQRSSIRLSLGETGTRSVKFVAEPRATGGVLRIVNAVAQSRAGGKTATIGFKASQDATVRVRVMRADGSYIRDVVTRDVLSGTDVSVTWDHRDAKGVSVPAGLYSIVVAGSTADGQTAKQTVQYLVIR